MEKEGDNMEEQIDAGRKVGTNRLRTIAPP